MTKALLELGADLNVAYVSCPFFSFLFLFFFSILFFSFFFIIFLSFLLCLTNIIYSNAVTTAPTPLQMAITNNDTSMLVSKNINNT